jgi:hypothetical protein
MIDPERLAAELRNEDIHWEGSYFGLQPALVGQPAKLLADLHGESVVASLVRCLDNPEAFAAAHVLLTMISGVEHATIPWNGLVVDLKADGRAQIDFAQRIVLAERWRRWFAMHPHPQILPD